MHPAVVHRGDRAVDRGLFEMGSGSQHRRIRPAGPDHRISLQDFVLGCADSSSRGEFWRYGSLCRRLGGRAKLWFDSRGQPVGLKVKALKERAWKEAALVEQTRNQKLEI